MLLEELSSKLRRGDGDDVDVAKAEACDFGFECLHVVVHPPECWLVSHHLWKAADDRVGRRARWKRVLSYSSTPFVQQDC